MSLGEAGIAVANDAADRPADEYHFECSKHLRQSRLECQEWHFSLSQANEFQQQASPTFKCQSTTGFGSSGCSPYCCLGSLFE